LSEGWAQLNKALEAFKCYYKSSNGLLGINAGGGRGTNDYNLRKKINLQMFYILRWRETSYHLKLTSMQLSPNAVWKLKKWSNIRTSTARNSDESAFISCRFR
jgi:hypothetical protein